jgi:hypothetical protein
MALQLPKGGIGWKKIKKRGLGGGREHCVKERRHKGLGPANHFDQFYMNFALE